MISDDIGECCKALSGICNNNKCIHWDQHVRGIDYRYNNNPLNKKCGHLSWCSYIKAKVRCFCG